MLGIRYWDFRPPGASSGLDRHLLHRQSAVHNSSNLPSGTAPDAAFF